MSANAFFKYFPSETLTKTFAAINEGALRETADLGESTVINYRAVGSARHVPAGFVTPKRNRRPQPDDISLRMLLAHRAMKSAGCSKPAAAVVDALKKTK